MSAPARLRHLFFGFNRQNSAGATRERDQNAVLDLILGRLSGTQFPEPPPAVRLAVHSALLPITVSVPFIASPLTVPV
jgi:hypothetical protein